jgi:3-isopropylmalate/(R)-2-methylmalate dehydratase small subunit
MAGQRSRLIGLGRNRNTETGAEYQATAYPPFMRELIEAGGLIEYPRRKLRAGG